MIPALIDLHVRPSLNEFGQPDVELLAVQARDQGLDGVVVVGHATPVVLGETTEISAATGVQLFSAVELNTDAGVLLCYPRCVDEWFTSSAWLAAIGSSKERGDLLADDVIRVFSERGGAVVAVPRADAVEAGTGIASGLAVSGVLVTLPELDDRTVALAQSARLTCVGASAAGPGQARFGAAATVFAAPPMTQEALVDGLRSGRVWPAEFGEAALARYQQPQAAPPRPRQERTVRAPQPVVEATPTPADTAPRAAPQPTVAGPAKARPSKQRGKVDPFERPGDNRGNRFNRDGLRRKWSVSYEESQPSFDPVAAMYGLDGRKVLRLANKTDVELDRINGNRNKGPDPNIMMIPSFDELRQERQHINLLFASTEEEDDLDDSVALRFAMSHFAVSNSASSHGDNRGDDYADDRDPNGGANRRGRRRRR